MNIYDINGNIKCVVQKFSYNDTFMGETFLTMDIESPNAISFDIGDNCSYRGDIFTLNYIPSVEKTASTYSRGDAFKYSSVKMNSVADELTRCRMLDIVPDDMNVVWTGLPEFSFYAQTVNDLARRLQANLDSLYKDAKKWTVTVNLANLVDYNGVLCSISGKAPIDSVMSISGKSCMEILAECWNTFRVTYIIRGRTISIAPTPIEVGATFGYGINHGLYGLQQQTKQDAQIITRLYVYGSTRNIGNHYYANLTGKGKGTIDSTVSSLETERLSFDAATGIIHDGTVNLTLGGAAHNIPMTTSLNVANTVRDHIYDLRDTEFPSWTVTKGDTNSVIRVDFSIIDKYIDVNIGSRLTIEFQGQTLYVPFTQKFTYSQVSSFVNFIQTRFVDADDSGGDVQQYWSIVNYVNGDTHLDFKCFATGPRSNAEITLNTITGLGVTPTLTEKGALYLDFKANSGGGRLETPTIDVNSTGLVASVYTSTYGLYPYGTMNDNLYYFTLDFAYGTKYYKESRTQNGITQYIVKFKVGNIEVNGYIELDDTHVVGIVYQTEPNSAAFYSAMQTSTYIYITSGLYLDLLSSEYVSYNETISGNLAVNRLMLPDFPLVHNSPNDVYLDSPNISKYGIRQGYVIFDGSDTSKPEIYPTIHQMTAKNVIDSGITLSLDSAEGTDMSAIRLDKIKGSIMPTDGTKDGNIPTSVDYNYNSWQTTFTIFLKDLGFDLSQISGDKYYYATSDKMSISMISGTCAGREFQIDSIKRNTDLGYLRYELVCERSQDTNINKVYPYDSYPVSAGDEFVILNCRLPKVYVDANSQKLKDYGEAYLAKNDKTKYTYSPKVDEIWMDKNPTIANSIKAGDIFDFSDADLDLNVKSFIHTLTIKVGDKSLPSYDITLDEEVESTTIQKIQNQINNISLTTGVSTNITDVQQATATYGNDYFVSKNNDDTVSGNISFKQDISVRGKSVLQSTSVADLKVGKDITVDGDTQFGPNYVEGITGMGGKIDKDANAEFESLTLRKFLQVPEIDYNRVDIKVGDKWRAPGGGVIKSVDTDNKIVTLKLEDGEIGAVEVGDICMGIFHSTTTSDNSTSNSDDSKGNRTFAGFFTCYFHITEVLDANHTQFKYELRPIDDNWKLSFAPCEAMNFVGYGNFTNVTRQTSVYETTTYTRMLVGQNTWEFSIDNIAMQYGNLTNLDIFGLDMTGYSIYLVNIYMKGAIKQVKDNGSEIKQINFLANYTVGQNIDYYDALYYSGSTWVCINKNGTNTTPSENDTINWMILAKQGSSVKVASEYQENVTNTAGTILSFYNMLFAARVDTQQPPLEILSDQDGTYITDENGNYLLYVQDGDVVQNNDWILLIDMRTVANAKDGQNGESLEVRYSSDKSNWHEVYLDGDIWMQQRVGSNNVWSSAMRVVGESGTDGVDGKYTVYEFAKNNSTDIAPTSGWQDAPMATSTGEYLWMRSGVVIPPATTPSSWAAVRIKGDEGDKGDKGDSGDSVKLLYRYEIDKPTKPTGSNPNGWSNTPDKEIITITHGTNFTLKDGYYVSPAISHSSIIKNRIYFSTTKVNQSIAIELSVSSEPNYDCALIGILDDNNLTINSNYTKKISGITTIIAIVDIPNIGSHFIDVGYAKDISASSNDDNCKYRIVDINKCWISTGYTISGLITWSDPVIFINDNKSEEYIYALEDLEITLASPKSDKYIDDFIPKRTYTDYSQSLTWAIGSEVIYNSNYYRCIIANSSTNVHLPTETLYWKQIEPWTDNPQGVSLTKKYEYISKRTKVNGVWGEFSIPTIWARYSVDGNDGDKGDKGNDGDKGDKGDTGDKGIQGCVIRDSEWVEGTQYLNQSNVKQDGIRYIDIALIANSNATTGWDAYLCLQNHVANASNKPGTTGGNTYWEQFSANVTAIFTSLIIAKNAKIKFLQGNQLLLMDSDNNIVGGLSGFSTDSNDVRLWIGGSDPSTAPYRVMEDGSVTATKMLITGDSEVRNCVISGTLNGVSGTFNYLQGVGSNGKFWFNNHFDAMSIENEDFNQLGIKNNRTVRFYASDIRCKGSFGALCLNMARVHDTVIDYYVNGYTTSYVRFNLQSNGVGGYYIPLYPTSNTGYSMSSGNASLDDVFGFPVDLLIFNNSTNYHYEMLPGSVGKKVIAVNANNNNTVYLAINGELNNWTLAGGVAHTFINIREFMTPSVSSSVHGAGWLSCGGHDNDWA